jgi:uncharacterized protein YicC (UPF0701 family)
MVEQHVEIGVPQQILDSLPDDDNAEEDMKRAVAGLEAQLNQAIESADSEGEAAGYVVDTLERLEEHLERYDEFVPELRAWGQSPIYAIAWRNLQADLILQIHDHDWLSGHVDRERNQRIVEDGIRFGGR